jgi:cyclophilin family peptidyl-prolyl cis-trans isomerase
MHPSLPQVFGRVVGGHDVLNAMEKIATDDDDRPPSNLPTTFKPLTLNAHSRHSLHSQPQVFGRVVGGLDVMNAMEKIATDDDDRPSR